MLLEGLDRSALLREIDFRPKTLIRAWLVGIDPFPAILLFMALLSTENAGYLIPVRVIARIWSLLLLIVVPVVVLGSIVLAVLWPVLLASILVCRETPLSVLRDGLHIFFFLLLLYCLNL